MVPITCPHCWQEFHLPLDLSQREQAQTEDCTVCCRPLAVRYRTEDGALVFVDVRPENG